MVETRFYISYKINFQGFFRLQQLYIQKYKISYLDIG